MKKIRILYRLQWINNLKLDTALAVKEKIRTLITDILENKAR